MNPFCVRHRRRDKRTTQTSNILPSSNILSSSKWHECTVLIPRRELCLQKIRDDFRPSRWASVCMCILRNAWSQLRDIFQPAAFHWHMLQTDSYHDVTKINLTRRTGGKKNKKIVKVHLVYIKSFRILIFTYILHRYCCLNNLGEQTWSQHRFAYYVTRAPFHKEFLEILRSSVSLSLWNRAQGWKVSHSVQQLTL